MTNQRKPWEHDHTFGQDVKRPGELRTMIVVLLTTATMFLEIIAGNVYGSMALLADGLHMASHATALLVSLMAYVYARRHAQDGRFSFGTGKVNSLAGFSGAILLALFAIMMAWESVERLFQPIPIAFNQALTVAVVGLLVNGLSVMVLGHSEDHDDASHEECSCDADAERTDGHAHDHRAAHHHDHNLRSAYLHVLADTLTSVLAIGALLAGKYLQWKWLDPAMGIVGAILVARWSVGLLKATGRVLLDAQASVRVRDGIRERVRSLGGEVIDLHVWTIGPGVHAVICSVVADEPRSPDQYRSAVLDVLRAAHITIEVWPRCAVSSGSS